MPEKPFLRTIIITGTFFLAPVFPTTVMPTRTSAASSRNPCMKFSGISTAKRQTWRSESRLNLIPPASSSKSIILTVSQFLKPNNSARTAEFQAEQHCFRCSQRKQSGYPWIAMNDPMHNMVNFAFFCVHWVHPVHLVHKISGREANYYLNEDSTAKAPEKMKRTWRRMERSLDPASSALQITPWQAGFIFFAFLRKRC